MLDNCGSPSPTATPHSKPGSLPEPNDIDMASIISGESLVITPPSPAGVLVATSESQLARATTVVEPRHLYAYAQRNENLLVDIATSSGVIALAVAARANTPLATTAYATAHWIIWADAAYRQTQFAYNLAVETGVEVHIRPAEAAPLDLRLDRLRIPLSPLQTRSPSRASTPPESNGRQCFTTSRRSYSRRSNENADPFHANPENWRPSSHFDDENIQPSRRSRARPLSRSPADPTTSADVEQLPAHTLPQRLPRGAQAPHLPLTSATSYIPYQVGRTALLPPPCIGPQEDETIPIQPDAEKRSMIDVWRNQELSATLSLSMQRGRRDRLAKQEITVPLVAKLNFARDQHELAGGYLTVASNGYPHTLHLTYDNPIPLGTPKTIHKYTDTRTVGATVGLAPPGVNVAATASLAVGSEQATETQWPATTPYVSRISENKMIGQTVEIIPHDHGTTDPSILVDMEATVDIAQPSQRGARYELPLFFTAQWHLRDRSKRKIGFYHVVVFQVAEDVWGGNWEADSVTRSVVSWADEPQRNTVTGLQAPALYQLGDIGKSVVVGLRSRLEPETRFWFSGLRTIFRRMRKRTVPPRELKAGAYEMWGRRGWIPVDVGQVLQVPLVDSLYPDGSFVFDALQVHHALHFREPTRSS
ncbi:hypothetical protein R3P38DRAFT_3076612 [Favolaschia claudopus]|uniref:Uncharacterized protein n=1 Tax=Favolaschia claudopus TaxID=2862362 RepID=A0AAV9ZWR3_9AGAR